MDKPITRTIKEQAYDTNEPDFYASNKKQCLKNTKKCDNCEAHKTMCICEDFAPRRCRKTTENPSKDACRYHGYGSKKGPRGGRPLKHGDYSQLAETNDTFWGAYDASYKDPELESLRAEISILDAISYDILGTMEDGGVTGREAWREFRKGMRLIEAGEVPTGLEYLVNAINDENRLRELRGELRANFGERRKLADSERKRLIDMEMMITVEHQRYITARIFDVLMKTIEHYVEIKRVPEFVQDFEQGLGEIYGTGATEQARLLEHNPQEIGPG
ncbi:hypothetical protein LCGC14_1743290 [marine sediment metagenome]|uniref:Uncharacterized protein n=1 Tax=marine sediment metagenome TaxID=412755 RepID=A0A0F9K5N6_9ZZZZ